MMYQNEMVLMFVQNYLKARISLYGCSLLSTQPGTGGNSCVYVASQADLYEPNGTPYKVTESYEGYRLDLIQHQPSSDNDQPVNGAVFVTMSLSFE